MEEYNAIHSLSDKFTEKKHTLIHELSTNCVLLLPNPQNVADVEKWIVDNFLIMCEIMKK